jgi:hypothetical protein
VETGAEKYRVLLLLEEAKAYASVVEVVKTAEKVERIDRSAAAAA